jgi:hypothetical protein
VFTIGSQIGFGNYVCHALFQRERESRLLTLDDVHPGAARSVPPSALRQSPPRIAVRFLDVTLFLCLASSFFTFIQPAPYEFLAGLVAFACLAAGVSIDVKILPMVFLLFLLQIGGLMSLIPIWGDQEAQTFVIISIYLAVTGVILAIAILDDTQRRYELIANGYVVAGVCAAIFGIIGYFQLAPGSEAFLMSGRAVSTFKDPNITGAFYIPPLLFLLAIFFTSRIRPLQLIAFLIIAVGLLLAFSRAAWGQFTFTTIIMWLLLFITRQNAWQRQRMILIIAVMGAALVGLLLILFSIEAVQKMILERATLFQAYDTGTEGSRFNIQQRSIENILEHPNGMGPWVFGRVYGLVSHNSYLGVFLNHGWLGGIAYVALTVTTLAIGFRSIFVRTPWQVPMVAVLCAYVGMCLESIIVDTDHWRNYYLLVGMMWGMFAATVNYQRRERQSAAAYG